MSLKIVYCDVLGSVTSKVSMRGKVSSVRSTRVSLATLRTGGPDSGWLCSLMVALSRASANVETSSSEIQQRPTGNQHPSTLYLFP